MRLVDAFQTELRERGLVIPGVLAECGTFGDLLWPPCGDRAYVASRATADPAFTLTGYSRLVALARVLDEIRFYAAAIPQGATDWWWSGEEPQRVAAVRTESDRYELAIFKTLPDAVTFTVRYLGGAVLAEIDVVRITPTPERYR